MWFRTNGKVPDGESLHRRLLAYVSDFYLLDTAALPHGLSFFSSKIIMASIDHAMWFHRSLRVDDWLLYALDSPSASGARGFGRGSVFSRDGRLVPGTQAHDPGVRRQLRVDRGRPRGHRIPGHQPGEGPGQVERGAEAVGATGSDTPFDHLRDGRGQRRVEHGTGVQDVTESPGHRFVGQVGVDTDSGEGLVQGHAQAPDVGRPPRRQTRKILTFVMRMSKLPPCVRRKAGITVRFVPHEAGGAAAATMAEHGLEIASCPARSYRADDQSVGS